MKQANRKMAIDRTTEMAAIFMIGDGILGIMQPERHVALWRSDLVAIDVLVRPFGGKPGHRRLYGVLQLVTGIVLASRLQVGPDYVVDESSAERRR